MAPEPSSGHGDPAAGGAPPAGPTPEGFEHEEYEHDLPGSDAPFSGPIANLVGMVLDGSQRARLAEGLTTRPPGSIPHTNANSFEHAELKRMIDDSAGAQVHELGEMWNDLGNEIMDFGASLDSTATNSEAIWVGQAGTAARSTLTGLATWSQQTGQGVQYMGTTMRTQAEAAQTAKTSMPDPVEYNPAEYQDRLNSTSNLGEWIQILGDAQQQAERSNAAHAEAVRVTETYSTSLHDTSGTMPAFAPPQQVGNGDTGLTSGGPMPGGGGGLGGGGAPGGGGAGGGVPGGIPGPGGGGSPGNGPGVPVPGSTPPQSIPPQSTPPQSVPHVPGIPGSPGSGGHGPGGGTGVPGFVPAAAGFGGPGTGAAGRGSGVGGSRGAGGGGFGPRGSGGLGASNPLGRGGFGAAGAGAAGGAGAAEGAAGAGRGAAGMAGRGLGAGGGAFAPMGGGARGQGSEDSEHRRPSYLVETEDIWGDGRRVAPPVIGEEPPEYYR